MNYKNYIAEKISDSCNIATEELSQLVAYAPNSMADFCLPCFKFAKMQKTAPNVVAEQFKCAFDGDDSFSKIEIVNGYLNFILNRSKFAKEVLSNLLSEGDSVGKAKFNGETICIDFSSINIAKPFHIGHLSTTVIGGALTRIYRHLGYNVVAINHLGDYGTQFGKLISAFKRWGDKELIEKGGVRELSKIYVKFHEEAEKDESLNDEARSYFKSIENGDEEVTALFHWFKELTLKEVAKVYESLKITFDSYDGEAFFNDKMGVVIDELKEKKLLVESNGAEIVDLEAYNMPPCLILRSDGATLYATRDLAAAIYRKNTYDFKKCLYVVAYQQNLHFKQFFKVLELMGKTWANSLEHIAFGMVSLEGEGSLSTRKGNVIYLEDVISKCNEKALEIISAKEELEDKETIAKIIGTGAVIFSALTTNRIKDIVFSYDKVLSFEGETGPYVQYSATRAKSVLTKAGAIGEVSYDVISDTEHELIKLLYGFSEVLNDVVDKNEPFFLTRRLIEISQAFNKFYYFNRIIGEEEGIKNFRLTIASVTCNALTVGLNLLGIDVPTKM